MTIRSKPFHLHIIGVCGTFMGGLAVIARELGYHVSGSDQNVYPPMSTQLEQQGISLQNGYAAANLEPAPDLVVIGNAASRGNPEVEAVLNQGLPYVSGPQWLAEHVLQSRWVLAVSGTHGKTTTSSLLSWILEYNGLHPGFLIGGAPLNFDVSARLGASPYFVVEADEYDSAFFDKRSKFVHYRPRTLVLNNLEYDHADIFENLDAIKKQFHHLLRTVPSTGRIIAPAGDANLTDVISQGCWTPVEYTSINTSPAGIDTGPADWQATLLSADGGRFAVSWRGERQGEVAWSLTGRHNVANALSALAAARHAGVEPKAALAALASFQSVKRRMEPIVQRPDVTVYDDFAHHPTAVQTTLEGLRRKVGDATILAVLEPRSNTMRMGVHRETLAASLQAADLALIYQSANLGWDPHDLREQAANIRVSNDLEEIVAAVKAAKGHVVLMSNGGFGGIQQRLQREMSPPPSAASN